MEYPADIIEAARAACLRLNLPTDGPAASVIRQAIFAERQNIADFCAAKYDWPPAWIAASLRGENSAYFDFVRDRQSAILSPATMEG